MKDYLTLIKELMDSPRRDRYVASKVKDYYQNLTGIIHPGCLCSSAVRTDLFNKVEQYLKDK